MIMPMSNNSFSEYDVICEDVEGYYEEKKSKFLCYLHFAQSEEEASEFVSKIKKKHYDARHNCTAMIIGPQKELQRSSDDGEPSGTAGKPMLEVLLGADITNVVCVVTRYFGGVLLGTGGLVKAYQCAVKDALENARNDKKIATITFCTDIMVSIDYSQVNTLEYYIGNNDIKVVNKEYQQNVTYTLRAKADMEESIIDSLTNQTNGTASIEKLGTGYYPL